MLKNIGFIFTSCLFSNIILANQLEEVNIFCKSESNYANSYLEDKNIKILGETKTILCNGNETKIFSISKNKKHFFEILGKLSESCKKGIQYNLDDSSFYNLIPVNNSNEHLSSFAIENTYKKGQFLLFSPLSCNK
nr:hypothetical protein GTC16762_07380 [Pigmentibacter ruber]